MTCGKCSKKDLQQQLKHNSEAQIDIHRRLQQTDICEETLLQSLNIDSSESERLYCGWTGDAAKKYIQQVREENERFRRRYMDVFAQERERLHKEQNRLRFEEQDISDALIKQTDNDQKKE